MEVEQAELTATMRAMTDERDKALVGMRTMKAELDKLLAERQEQFFRECSSTSSIQEVEDQVKALLKRYHSLEVGPETVIDTLTELIL
jgi:hypothetical protein